MKADKHIYPSVHRGIVRAAMCLLEQQRHPAASFYTVTDLETMVEEAAKPDAIGDRQQGRGLHYYCAVTPTGHPIAPTTVGTYFLNGKGQMAPSLRTMFEGEYQAAVLLRDAGKYDAAMKSLSRAAHMLADLCCPPHACGLTYFSRYAMHHKRYESRAASMFWETQPVDEEYTAAARWAGLAAGNIPESTFSAALLPRLIAEQILDCSDDQADDDAPLPIARLLNQLAQASAAELPYVIGSDMTAMEASIRRRLICSIRSVAALFATFAAHMHEEQRGCLHENRPLYIHALRVLQPLLQEPIYLQIEYDGSLRMTTADGRYLAVTRLGTVQLTHHIEGKKTRFRIGKEAWTQVFYVEGDQNHLLGVCGKRLCSMNRQFYQEYEIGMRTGLFLLEEPLS